MEITKDNYLEMESKIIAEIELSDFVSLDLELTGLCAYLENFLDTPEERYLKQKSTAERFRIIQLGIVTWKKGSDHQYTAKPFNFYVFPSEENGNHQLNCEVSAIIFNRTQGMDFNKWIRKGVNYINSRQLKYLTDSIMEYNINLYDPSDSSKFKNISLYKEEDKVKYAKFYSKFSEFFYSLEKTSFEFEKPPRFFMLFLLNNLKPCIRNTLYINETIVNGKQMYVMTKVNEEERRKLFEAEVQEKMGELSKSKGVKNIFDAIIKGKKTVIGHNCILDVLFCMSHFGDPLPNAYQDFKKMIKESFGGLFDTKLMFSLLNPNQKETHLENVFKTLHAALKEKIAISIPTNEGFTDFLSEEIEKFHQADYDAFVTGCAFVYMIESMKDNLNRFNYKLNMMKSFYHCYDLLGEETFEEPNCVCYCLKPIQMTYEFELQKTLQPKYFEMVKKSYYIDNCNAYLILVQVDSNGLNEFEYELLKHHSLFRVHSLADYKKLMKEEDEKRKKALR